MQRTPSWVVSEAFIPNQEVLVKACRYLWVLDPKAMRFLVSAAPIIEFKKGDILSLNGQACNAAFLVFNGQLVEDVNVKSTPTTVDKELVKARFFAWQDIRDSNLFSVCLNKNVPELTSYVPGAFVGEEELLTGAK